MKNLDLTRQLWRFIHIVFPGADGNLLNFIDPTLEVLKVAASPEGSDTDKALVAINELGLPYKITCVGKANYFVFIMDESGEVQVSSGYHESLASAIVSAIKQIASSMLMSATESTQISEFSKETE